MVSVEGGSGSGKSTVTRQVLASIGPEMATVVYLDDYYLDQTEALGSEHQFWGRRLASSPASSQNRDLTQKP